MSERPSEIYLRLKSALEQATRGECRKVDMVAVVRCKDCEYWEYDVIFPDGWCRVRHQGNPEWFCADGKRKEE